MIVPRGKSLSIALIVNYLANVNKSLDQGSVVLINKLTSNIGFHVFLFPFNEIVFAKY